MYKRQLLDGQFDWGGRLQKSNGGAQRFPQNGRKSFEECKGRRAVSYTHLDVYKRQIVSEIPYMVNKANLIETIADLVKDKKIDGISDLRDESDSCLLYTSRCV